MFKLVVLSALIACGTAAPSGIHGANEYAYAGPVSTYAAASPVLVEQHLPAVAKVAEYVEHVPTSVSHHSSSIVHNTAAVATPVITPVAKTTIVSAPAPILHSAPVVATPARTIVEAAPAPILHSAPVVAAPARTIVEAAPIVEEIREAQYIAPVVHQQEYAKVAEYVEHVPSSVSHHSSSIVHNTAAVATPVITPVAKTTVVSAPAPILHSAPARTIVEATPAPILHSAQVVAAPARTIVEASPIVQEIREAQYIAPVVRQQEYAKVAEVVEHVPSSVSHHSSSIVHNTAAVATPVITPVAKTTVVSAPVYKSAPLLQTVQAPNAYAVHAPSTYAVHAPAAYAVRDASAYAVRDASAYAVHGAPLYNALPYAGYNYGTAVYGGPLLRAH